MVTREDLRLNFVLFHIFSVLCFIPCKVDIKSCRVTFLVRGLKALIHRAIFAVVVLNYVYSGIQFIRSIKNKEMFVAAHFPIHLLCLEYAYFVLYQVYTLGISNPETTTVLLREISKFPPKNPRESFMKHVKGCVKTWSLQDCVMVSFPSTLLNAAVGMTAIFMMDPHRAQLLSSVLEPHQKNVWTLTASIGVEIFCQTFCHAIAGLGIVGQLFFFKTATRKLADKNWDPIHTSTQRLIMKFRKLQVLVNLFNDSYSVIVFGEKQFCIYVCILQASFGLVYLEKDALIGAFCLGIALEAAISYVVLYDHAFSIPLVVENIKQRILVERRTNKVCGNAKEWSELEMVVLKKTLQSLPLVGVKVGTFCHMERSSTLNFLDFVTSQTVGLLISLRS